MADGIATGRREGAARPPNARNACRAAEPISPIVRQPAPRARRRSGAVIPAMPGTSIATATVSAANNTVRPMTEEEHLWGCALAIERLHGADAPLHIAERIGALALAGDLADVTRWQSIAACLAELQQQRTTN